jgi:biotin operon repressor
MRIAMLADVQLVVKMSQKTEQGSGKRVRRMLQMIMLLQESQIRSPMELAEQFGVSRRTIFRDVQLLRDTGFPVLIDKKGYELKLRIVQQMDLEPLELIALAGGDCMSTDGRLPFLQTAREMALAKITATGTTLTQAQVQYVRERISKLLDDCAGEDLDETTVEALIENWIAEAQKQSLESAADAEPADEPEAPTEEAPASELPAPEMSTLGSSDYQSG